MLQLNVIQQNAKARLDIRDPFVTLRTQDVQVKVSSTPVKLEISSPEGELSIDQYPFWRSLGILHSDDFDREQARKGMQAMYEAIGKAARDGVRLMKIEHKGNIIPSLGAQDSAPKEGELIAKDIEGPRISYTPHDTKVSVTPSDLNIQFVGGNVDISAERGTVDLSMLQYPEVNFKISGTNLDAAV